MTGTALRLSGASPRARPVPPRALAALLTRCSGSGSSSLLPGEDYFGERVTGGYHVRMMDADRGSRACATSTRADCESLILVDEADREVGHLGKVQCHEGRGVLHRAFSLLIFNAAGELLLQQRAASKRLWPSYWSNSCCSHPRRSESMEAATERRLYEELGLRCPLRFLYKFQYQAQFDAAGAEQELCSVFIGRSGDPVRADRNEILAWRWVSPQALHDEIASAGARRFTPWFLLEWARVWRDHRSALRELCAS